MDAFAGANPVPESEILSGERLQSLADVAIIWPDKKARHRSLPKMPLAELAQDLRPTPEALAAIDAARCVFVYAEMIHGFFEHVLPSLSRPIVLVTHNADTNIDGTFRKYVDHPLITHWFAQNVVLPHPKLTPIPIGMANAQWPHGNSHALADTAKRTEGRPKVSGLYVNFETRTNPAAREPILAALRPKPFAVMGRRPTALGKVGSTFARWRGRPVPIRDKPLPYPDYLKELAHWRFCVSPPGNGLDCHRTWEALYLGVVPVLAAPIPKLLDGLPHLLVGDFERLTLEQLEAAYSRLPEASGLNRLRLSYWRQQVDQAIAKL